MITDEWTNTNIFKMITPDNLGNQITFFDAP